MKEDKIKFYQLSIPIKIALIFAWVVGILYVIVFVAAIFGVYV